MDSTVIVVGILVALAAAVVTLPARRERPAGLDARLDAATGKGADGGSVRSQCDVGGVGSVGGTDVGLMLTEVATLLRAGATPRRAWSRSLARTGLSEGVEPGDDGVPPALLDLGEAAPERWWPVRVRGRWVWRPPFPGPGLRAARERRRAAAAAVPGAVAACRLTAALGAPLAEILEAVAGGVAESGHAEASRRTALSGPQSTARLLAMLPLVGLLLGAAVGARPEEVLLDGGMGSALAVLGVGLMIVGRRVTARMVASATVPTSRVDEALVLDLAAAALACGASLPGALQALGEALEEEELVVAGRALLLGADWDEAWRQRRRRLEGCLRPGWEDGASPAPLLTGTAASLRAGRRAADEEAAERLAVRLVLPLGLCHLPAFVVLGIAPVVMSVGLDLLGG
mgnify:CR=1 FL=1